MRVKRRIPSMDELMRQRLMLENRRLESEIDILDSYVNPAEAYIDELTSEEWLPVTGYRGEFNRVPFRTEQELSKIRERARIQAERNPYVKNFINSLVAYTIGRGHIYNCVPRKSAKRSVRVKSIAKLVQRFVDNLLLINKWKKRQKDIWKRYHRDGEAFIRLFPQANGMTLWRFIEPGCVYTPPKYQGLEHYSFGIETEADDCETQVNYWVEEKPVPAYEVQHRKANVDMDVKRGLSSIYAIRANAERADKLLRNMTQTISNQVSISMIRHHKNAPPKAVQSFAAQYASTTFNNPTTGEQTKYKKTIPGQIIDTNDDIEYEFPSAGAKADAPIGVLAAELRAIASSKSLAEYMVGSDASNASYASTMVSESPAVREFEIEQAEVIDDDLELIWAAIEHAVNTGLLPAEALSQVEITVAAPRLISRDPLAKAKVDDIYLNHQVKSPQTVAAEENLDYQQEAENWAAIPSPPPGQPAPGSSLQRPGRFTGIRQASNSAAG